MHKRDHITDHYGHLLEVLLAILWARQGARYTLCSEQGAGNGNCAEHPRQVSIIGPYL